MWPSFTHSPCIFLPMFTHLSVPLFTLQDWADLPSRNAATETARALVLLDPRYISVEAFWRGAGWMCGTDGEPHLGSKAPSSAGTSIRVPVGTLDPPPHRLIQGPVTQSHQQAIAHTKHPLKCQPSLLTPTISRTSQLLSYSPSPSPLLLLQVPPGLRNWHSACSPGG